jgi:DNA-binding protein H-NS
LPREVRVEEIAERQRDAERRKDAAEHRVGRQLHDPEAEAGQHDHVQQYVGEEPEESVPIAGNPQSQASRRRRAGDISRSAHLFSFV